MKQWIIRYEKNAVCVLAEYLQYQDNGVFSLRVGHEIVFLGSLQHIIGVESDGIVNHKKAA